MPTLLVLWITLAQAGLPIHVDSGKHVDHDAQAAVDIALHFPAGVPQAVEVTRLSRTPGSVEWQVAGTVQVPKVEGPVVLRGPSGVDSLLLVRAAGQPGYLLEGPFRWPDRQTTRSLRTVWRRTVRGSWEEVSQGPLTWVPAHDQLPDEPWPACRWLAANAWECIGVPLEANGVVLHAAADRLFYAVAVGQPVDLEAVSGQEAAWGRLVVARRREGGRMSAADRLIAEPRRAAAPALRPNSVRLDLVADDRVSVRRVADDALWICGTSLPEATWVQMSARGRAPLRLHVADLAAGSSLPLVVHLDEGLSIHGRSVTTGGHPAAGAAMVLFRVIEPDAAAPSSKRPPHRVLVMETTSGPDGEFRFDDLAPERYEIVALHRSLGRGERQLEPGAQPVEVRLKPPAVAVGRVLRDGVPAAGVPVASVPDLGAAAQGTDLTELVGGHTVTDSDGRFRVSLPPRGLSEVRVGDQAAGLKRLALGPADSLPPVTDLGTIALEPGHLVRFVLEDADGCELIVSGPIGRSGVTAVTAARTGPAMFEAPVPEAGHWLLSARCGGQRRLLQPTIVEVGGAGPVTLSLAWKF